MKWQLQAWLQLLPRTAHAQSYLGLSPRLDFETILIAKRKRDAVPRTELSRPGYG